jgi:hypothetical protein
MYASYVERTKKRAPAATENNKKFKMGDDADELPDDERFGSLFLSLLLFFKMIIYAKRIMARR